MTGYIVFERREDGWFDVGSVEAHGASAAVRQVAEGLIGSDVTGELTGEFVAVPERSWRPQEFRVETVSRLVMKKAKAAA